MKMIQRMYGYFWIFMSVLFFFSMTVVVKFTTKAQNYDISIFGKKISMVITGDIHSLEVALFRFLTGFIIIISVLLFTKQKLRPVNKKALWARGVFNTLAVMLFFVTIQLANVTKGNVYNMTYPIFVACLAPLFLKEKLGLFKSISVGGAFLGTYMISGIRLSESFQSVGIGDFTGILSGFLAGVAIIALKYARRTEDSFTILYYLMAIGLGITVSANIFTFKVPNMFELIMLFGVGILSFMGQFSITYGYKYVTAVEGSIISSTRIFIAAAVGVLFLGEVLSGRFLFGAFLIGVSIIVITFIDSRKVNISN